MAWLTSIPRGRGHVRRSGRGATDLRASAALLCLSLLLAACGSQELPAQQECEDRGGVYHEEREECFGADDSAETESGTPSPTPLATATVTPEPTLVPTPPDEAEPDVVVTGTALLVPSDGGIGDLLGYQIVATVENRGAGWAKLLPFDSQWTVLDPGGGVTSTGQLASAYPQYVEPGGTAYLVTYDVQSGADPADFASVEIEPEFRPVDGPEVTFEVENTQVSYAGSYGLEGTGFVTASAARDFVSIGLICLDSDGRVLGVAEAQLIDSVEAGEREAFQTTGPPTQVQPDSCVTTIFEGSPNDFEF